MEILFKPILTERMTIQGEKLNRYGFIVDVRANRTEIKKVVEKAYNVNVKAVNTMNYAGKRKSRMTKSGYVRGRTNHFKKAIITLEKGETINFFSNI